MLRRAISVVALAAVIAPAAGRAQEWEETYEDYTEVEPPSDGYRVSVDEEPSASVELGTFEESLQPYGRWMVVGSYGRVWRPHVVAGWRPYFYGRWEWTDEGWLWASDEPWGWAAYHYGRWAYDPYYGWIWVPGNQWAPAWVSWRYSGDVIGWAPLAPGASVYVSSAGYAEAWWTFVPCDRFVAEPVYRVAYAPDRSRRFFDATVPAPARQGYRTAPGRSVESPAWGGPPRRSIEARTGRAVTPVRVVTAPSPGAAGSRQGEVSIYRPELRRRPGEGNGAVRSLPAVPSNPAGERGRSGGGVAPNVSPGPALREVHPAPRVIQGTGFPRGNQGPGGAVNAPQGTGRGGVLQPPGSGRGPVGTSASGGTRGSSMTTAPGGGGSQRLETRTEGGGGRSAPGGKDDSEQRRH